MNTNKMIRIGAIIFLFLSGMGSGHAQQVFSLNSSAAVQWQVAPQADVAEGIATGNEQPAGNAWIPATVPGTVFASYVAAGKEKDPNYGDNIYQVNKSKYDRSFWYRTQFNIPASFIKEKIWLHVNGINSEGDIYLNGKKLATLSGIMQRGRYDITALVNRNGANVLAVLVSIPKQPLNNYGSPTYISSAGWDWMPYVPGLNSGITANVFLSNTGSVVMEDPWVRTNLPVNARADLEIRLDLRNAGDSYQEVEIAGIIEPGHIRFTKRTGVEGNYTTSVLLNKELFPELCVNNPKLWWPQGYGNPHLYTCALTVKTGNLISDSVHIPFGIRKYTYDTIGGVLHVSVNGKRVFLKGGNWGMPEYMLRCSDEEYDRKVLLHKKMNYNIIRNWLGSTTSNAFYDACDKYGIMVWDDFWLNANPVLPADIHVFNSNAIEKIKQVRNHPCVAVWCGNNEGWPVPPLNGWLREDIRTYDAGDRYYQPNSHEENLSGSGLWGNRDPQWYFTAWPESMGGTPGWGLRTEIGTAVFPNIESFRKFIPPNNRWPRNDMWNKHFFGQNAFNADPDNYDKCINERYGKPSGIEEYTVKAQLLNIETNKAMYEGWLDHMWEDASGVMTWMSQSAYPSMVWQTYDYYYDLTGAYWGVQSACEPMHIQWNPVTNSVKVVNTTGTDYTKLRAEARVYNTDGAELPRFHQTAEIGSYSNTATESFVLPFYTNQKDLAFQQTVTASSSESGKPAEITDGNANSRWSSSYRDGEWIYVDLGAPHTVNRVQLTWEVAYAKEYKIQVSTDALNWRDAITVKDGHAGMQSLLFDAVPARYVRMMGIKRGTGWGYSLWDLKVFGTDADTSGLSNVHFIRLRLTDDAGKLLSENFYWRSLKGNDFTALNQLPNIKCDVTSRIVRRNGQYVISARVTSPAGIAFCARVQVVSSKTGESLLPAMISDSYFTLFRGEHRNVEIVLDENLLKEGGQPLVKITPYNNALANAKNVIQ